MLLFNYKNYLLLLLLFNHHKNTGIYGCYVTFDHICEPLTVEDIQNKELAAEKAKKQGAQAADVEDRLTEVWPWQTMHKEDGSFSFYLNIDAQEGQFYLNIFVRNNKENIPYNYPIEGLSMPYSDLVLASTLVLHYDGRPLFLNADKETDYVTDIIVLDDADIPMPMGYTCSSIGYIFDGEDDVESIRVCYTCEDTALPVTDVMLLKGSSVDSLEVPKDWVLCPQNLGPILLGEKFDEGVICLVFNRGERSEGFIPISSIKVSYNGEMPDEFEKIETPGDLQGGGENDNGAFICISHTVNMISVVEQSLEEEEEVPLSSYAKEAEVEVTESDRLASEMERKRDARMRLQHQIERKKEEKERFTKENEKLHRNLANVMIVRQQDAREKSPPSELQKRYNETLKQVISARENLHRIQSQYDVQAVELQKKYDEKEATANEIYTSFTEFKREISKSSENSRTGKTIPLKIITQFEVTEKKKEEEVEKVRLKNINLKTSLRKLEQYLKEKEQLAEGLHLIDFEQLKIENQVSVRLYFSICLCIISLFNFSLSLSLSLSLSY